MAAETSPLVSWAQLVGQHALALFLAGLLLAVGVTGLACVLLHRRRAGREQHDASARNVAQLLGSYGTGFLLIVGTASLFALLALRLGPGRTMGLADQALADAIGSHTPAAAMGAFSLLTHLGDPIALALLGAVVAIWLWQRRERLLATGWVIALAGNAVLNPLLKQVFARARPLHDLQFPQVEGYSFPSGHTSGALVAYGMLLYVATRMLPPRWHAIAAMAAVAMILTIACSRVFLRVHFASDVAAGILSGLSWLGVCVASLQFVRHRHVTRHAELDDDQ
ncbi:phosphatase PAP2 family protein [Variovorax rhizosphaerae]|uniref:Phosphatase PAP2 family protein n=1 Tax=Variovorax rhizosphaerae TaxID=1836200 RepID=A0ABU8WVW7_9BURK